MPLPLSIPHEKASSCLKAPVTPYAIKRKLNVSKYHRTEHRKMQGTKLKGLLWHRHVLGRPQCPAGGLPPGHSS